MKLSARQVEVLTSLATHPADATAGDVATHVPDSTQQGITTTALSLLRHELVSRRRANSRDQWRYYITRHGSRELARAEAGLST